MLQGQRPPYLDPDANANNPRRPAFEQAGETQVFTYDVVDPKTGQTTKQEVRFTVSIAKQITRKGYGFVEETSLQAWGW